MNDQNTTAWDHIVDAENRVEHAPDHAIAHALIAIAYSLAKINDRQGEEVELRRAGM